MTDQIFDIPQFGTPPKESYVLSKEALPEGQRWKKFQKEILKAFEMFTGLYESKLRQLEHRIIELENEK